jgi:SSS family solute:Na+ symporter
MPEVGQPTLHAIDWIIITLYLSFALIVGLMMWRKASTGLESYFLAGRSLPWWWLGTSMVATTFAADTPLAITGIVAREGISGNWFWWSWVLTYVTMTIFFSRLWRSSCVLTDVELIELRYSGKSAAFLRGFKAFYLAIIINCIILGWVFRAMSKIADPFIRWEELLPSGWFSTVAARWPDWLIFDNLNNTLTVLVIFALVIIYSSLGGIRGVVLTDLFQFALSVCGAVVFAVLAVDYVGGLGELTGRIREIYPDGDQLLNFWPSFDQAMLPFQVFLIYLGVQWWAKYWSDGSGYLAQRLNTAKNPIEAEKGALWFCLANFSIRTWPWIMVALVALVVFPKGNESALYDVGAQVARDREMAYPILMGLILPAGLLGIVFVSLLAAFMSTVDTHINWATSYLTHDIYTRFLRRSPSHREEVIAARSGVILVAIIAVIIASQINSIEMAWKFFIAVASGLGLPQLLRWVWWRANAWTEIAGMTTAFIAAVTLYTAFPDVRADYLLVYIVGLSMLASLIATFATRPTRRAQLEIFCERVKPFGFWRGIVPVKHAHDRFKKRIVAWVMAVICVFSGMFCVGSFLLLQFVQGAITLVLFVITLTYLIRRYRTIGSF